MLPGRVDFVGGGLGTPSGSRCDLVLAQEASSATRREELALLSEIGRLSSLDCDR